jgi:glycosyltransferase involved in cell wall biosynthesis
MLNLDKDLLVSISCITYNHVSYIRKCLDGFLNQKTNFLFEILIHDDASIDGTIDIIKEYETKFPGIVKPIYQTENQYSKGVKISFTYQFPRAKGKYVALCEGDDYWIDPYKLQKQVVFLEENPDYGLVHTNYIIVNKDNCLLKKINRKWPSGNVLMDIFYGNYHISTPTTMFRHSLYEEMKSSLSDNPIFKMGDLPLWLEFSYRSKVKYFHDPMVAYRVLDESASHSKDISYLYNFHKSALDIKWLYEKKFNLQLNHKLIEENLYRTMIKESYIRNDYSSACFYFKKAVECNKINLINPWNLLFVLGTKFGVVQRIIRYIYNLYS